MSLPKSYGTVVERVLAALNRTWEASPSRSFRPGRSRRPADYRSPMANAIERLEDLTLLSTLYSGVQVNDTSSVTIDKANSSENIAASADGDIDSALDCTRQFERLTPFALTINMRLSERI